MVPARDSARAPWQLPDSATSASSADPVRNTRNPSVRRAEPADFGPIHYCRGGIALAPSDVGGIDMRLSATALGFVAAASLALAPAVVSASGTAPASNKPA